MRWARSREQFVTGDSCARNAAPLPSDASGALDVAHESSDARAALRAAHRPPSLHGGPPPAPRLKGSHSSSHFSERTSPPFRSWQDGSPIARPPGGGFGARLERVPFPLRIPREAMTTPLLGKTGARLARLGEDWGKT